MLARSRPLLFSRLWLKSCIGFDFHTTPSVPLQAGVKFEHFVYPLRVESDVDKKRRLRRGAFCPLDTHADDDFALVFLANQGTAIVFLREKGKRTTHQRDSKKEDIILHVQSKPKNADTMLKRSNTLFLPFNPQWFLMVSFSFATFKGTLWILFFTTCSAIEQ